MRTFRSSLKQSRTVLIETRLPSVYLPVFVRENCSVSRGHRSTLKKGVSPSVSSYSVRRKRTALTTLPAPPRAASRARSSRPRSALNISGMKSVGRRKTSSKAVSYGATTTISFLRMNSERISPFIHFTSTLRRSLPVSDARTRVCMICATPQPR